MTIGHPHGTKRDPHRAHPVLDIDHWISEFPLGDWRRDGLQIDNPVDLARIEQAREHASKFGDLGPSVPADMFVWSSQYAFKKEQWRTRIGGRPWRDQSRPWPTDDQGVPLHFIGQICFADSMDLFPFELPGDIVLIFDRWSCGSVGVGDSPVLEWSSSKVDHQPGFARHPFAELPFCFEGVIHRSRQYTDWSAYEEPFIKAGWKDGGWNIGHVQATSVGTHASLPQGWPFEDGDGCTLVAVLSSYYFRGDWPLCDASRAFRLIARDGSEYEPVGGVDGLSLGIGDAGAIWIYRNKRGKFMVSTACG